MELCTQKQAQPQCSSSNRRHHLAAAQRPMMMTKIGMTMTATTRKFFSWLFAGTFLFKTVLDSKGEMRYLQYSWLSFFFSLFEFLVSRFQLPHCISRFKI
jgi:hypothetical protein